MAKKTGKGGSLTYANSVLGITNWEGDITVAMAVTTDSADYCSTTGLLWESKEPKKASGTVNVTGVFNDANTNTQLVLSTDLFNGSANAANCVLKIDTNTNFGYGLVRVSNFKVSPNITDETTPANWTATLETTGVFTPN